MLRRLADSAIPEAFDVSGQALRLIQIPAIPVFAGDATQRYKGLGEMNAEQLADTTMDPDKRTMLSVRVEDLVVTDLIFTTLMGEDVESQRRFIDDNAPDVKNPDV